MTEQEKVTIGNRLLTEVQATQLDTALEWYVKFRQGQYADLGEYIKIQLHGLIPDKTLKQVCNLFTLAQKIALGSHKNFMRIGNNVNTAALEMLILQTMIRGEWEEVFALECLRGYKPPDDPHNQIGGGENENEED